MLVLCLNGITVEISRKKRVIFREDTVIRTVTDSSRIELKTTLDNLPTQNGRQRDRIFGPGISPRNGPRPQ